MCRCRDAGVCGCGCGDTSRTEDLSYDAEGGTRVDEPTWTSAPPGYRRYESATLLGHGQQLWEDASAEVLTWA
jgi:uncharacterized protein (UPF0548 family)